MIIPGEGLKGISSIVHAVKPRNIELIVHINRSGYGSNRKYKYI